MKNPEQIFSLIKFGSRTNLEKLLTQGELYFNFPRTYNDWNDTEMESGDTYEGAEWMENGECIKIDANHPRIGKFSFKPVRNQLAKITQFNYHFLSYSLYAISSSTFRETNEFKIDQRNLDFKDADTAIFITEPYRFLQRITSVLNELNIRYEANFVEYVDIDQEGKLDLGPFKKKQTHKHQSEFRIIIENKDDSPKSIKIGSIEDYSHLVSAKPMVETEWKAKRAVSTP